MSRVHASQRGRLATTVAVFTSLLLVFPGAASAEEAIPVLDLIDLANGNDPGLPVPDGAVPVGVPEGTTWDVSVETIGRPSVIPEGCDIRSPLTCVPPITAAATAQQTQMVPQSCIHSSHNPHHSHREFGYVHARGKIECEMYKSLYIEGLLTRDRWYGEQKLHETSTKKSAYWNELINRWRCTGGTYTYHLYNYSSALGGGTFQDAYTGNTNRFQCPP
jgi:hypothetical protein